MTDFDKNDMNELHINRRTPPDVAHAIQHGDDGIIITDRYGGNYPDPATICTGQCEGMGWVPVHETQGNDAEGKWHDLWMASPAVPDDGYKFLTCPRCNGTGKEPERE